VKICTKCTTEKAIGDFYLSKGRPMAECKSCRILAARANALKDHDAYKARMNEYRVANLERIAETKRAWHQKKKSDPVYKSLRCAIQKRSYDRNPEKQRARAAERARKFPHLNAENARRHEAAKLQQCPAWADREAIRSIYAEAQRMSAATGIKHSVDHIVPLRHPLVAGLHVPANLRVVTFSENSRKRNSFTVESA
jgi:hypothetical protein